MILANSNMDLYPPSTRKESRSKPSMLKPFLRSTFMEAGLFSITFVIDDGGIIRHIYNSQMNARSHAVEAINALNAIRQNSGKSGN